MNQWIGSKKENAEDISEYFIIINTNSNLLL